LWSKLLLLLWSKLLLLLRSKLLLLLRSKLLLWDKLLSLWQLLLEGRLLGRESRLKMGWQGVHLAILVFITRKALEGNVFLSKLIKRD